MMRLLLRIVAGLLACTGMLHATDVTGKWSGIAGLPVWVTFHQDGAKLTGTAGQSPTDETLTFEDGKVDGDRLVFKAGTFHFDLRAHDGQITGEVDMGGGETARVVLRRLDANSAAAPRASFEVASVKKVPSQPGGYHSSMNLDPGRFTCTNATLRKLITAAYNIKDYQLTGPEWINSELYDITATLPAGATGEQVMPMIQSLLADRFHLVFHRENKELPVYALVVAKGGSKLTAAEFGRGGMDSSPGTLRATRIGMAKLADFLARRLDRPVLDMTELKGVFDFSMHWSPAETENTSDPDLLTALQQQLGLKLESRKAPVEILVVDQAEKVPTEN